jgi:hypothetical protein
VALVKMLKSLNRNRGKTPGAAAHHAGRNRPLT